MQEDDAAFAHCITFDELVDKSFLKAALLTSYGHDDELLQQAFGGIPTTLVVHPDRERETPGMEVALCRSQAKGYHLLSLVMCWGVWEMLGFCFFFFVILESNLFKGDCRTSHCCPGSCSHMRQGTFWPLDPESRGPA